MTIKQKFSSIDQSKLTADQKAFLTKIKDVTKNFTDAEMNKKVEAPLNGFIEKAKEKMPEAIKSAPVKSTSKAKPSQTRKPKRTAMSLAKEIRKQGESWNDARARASKMMKEDSKDLSKTVETELDKLSKLVKNAKTRAKLVGISGTNIKRDASRKAKPRGSRTVTHSGETSNQYGTFSNKLGRKYTENRDRHSDRLAPNYPKNAPYLADGGGVGDKYVVEGDRVLNTHTNMYVDYDFRTKENAEDFANHRNNMFKKFGKDFADGGYLTDPNFGNFQNTMFNKGGSITNERRYVNKGEDYEVRYSKPILRRKGYQGKRDFELGGVMTTDLAGHTGGGDAGLNAGMPLDGFSNTAYSGLVGETGAMSSGEMFMAGGSVDKNFDLAGFKRVGMFDTLEEAKTFANIERKQNSNFDAVVIEDNVRTSQPFLVFSKLKKGKYVGNRVYANGGGLPSGAEQSYMITEALGNPAQHFATGGGVLSRYVIMFEDTKGNKESMRTEAYNKAEAMKVGKYFEGKSQFQGFKAVSVSEVNESFATGGGVRMINGKEYAYGRNWTNDHRHINKDEEHEVKYNRKGKFLGIFEGGGDMNEKEFSLAQAIAFIKDAKKDKMTFYYNVYGGNDYFTLQPTFATPTGNMQGFPRKVTITKEGNISGRKLTYNKGGATTNERKHVNKVEDYEVRYAKPRPSRKGYKGVRNFARGGSMETPRIYVADLEAYNSGRLVGEWLDLGDYDNADELMDAIQNLLDGWGVEEYAIHDVEYVPRNMYSEYMGQRDFEELYKMMDLAKENDLPLEVVQDIVSQYSENAIDDFVGKYDSAVDFAEQLVDDLGGIQNFNDFQYYLDISETDRRLLSQEMADSYAEDIRDEDGGNRLIEEAGLNLDEYENADEQEKEELLDLATSMVSDEYYDTWYEGLNDPYYFLVEEQGMYSAEDFANANFIRVDYEKLADALDQDYTMIEYDGDIYVFNIR